MSGIQRSFLASYAQLTRQGSLGDSHFRPGGRMSGARLPRLDVTLPFGVSTTKLSLSWYIIGGGLYFYKPLDVPPWWLGKGLASRGRQGGVTYHPGRGAMPILRARWCWRRSSNASRAAPRVCRWRLCWRQTPEGAASDRQMNPRNRQAVRYCQGFRGPSTPLGRRAALSRKPAPPQRAISGTGSRWAPLAERNTIGPKMCRNSKEPAGGGQVTSL